MKTACVWMLSRTGSDLIHTGTNYGFNPKEHKPSRNPLRPVTLATREVKLSKMQSPSPCIGNYWEPSLAPEAERGCKALSFVSPTHLYKRQNLLRGWVLHRRPAWGSCSLLGSTRLRAVLSRTLGCRHDSTPVPRECSRNPLQQRGTGVKTWPSLSRKNLCLCF